MKFAGLLAFAVLSLPQTVVAASVSVPPVNRETAWFKPSLTKNSAAICEAILRVEQDAFFSPQPAPDYERARFRRIRSRDEELVSDPQVEALKDQLYDQLVLTLPGQQRVIVLFNRNPGCGGACETEQVLATDKAFEFPPGRRHDFPATPLTDQWTLYKATDGEFYTLGDDDGRLQAYRVAASARLELICEVELEPRNVYEHPDPAVRGANQSVGELRGGLAALAQDAGECGSGQFHRLAGERANAWFKRTLYQPWAVFAHEAHPKNYNSIDQALGTWALLGIAEHRALQTYREQLDRAATALASFYVEKYGWSSQQATNIAAKSLRTALSKGLSAVQYMPPREEIPLRQAILHRRPIDEIKQMQVPPMTVGDWPGPAQLDSLLNIAIEYPEALQYLLSKGRDPNEVNAFGKTPLMYAAQHNQLEAARILLAAGADPNAPTHIPEDTCYYTISTSGMTPLHYAARYASAEMIRLLVANGAATFNTTRDLFRDEVAESPLDWLLKYSGHGAPAKPLFLEPEPNPFIAPAELPALIDLLRVPDEEQREQISASFLEKSQAEYSRGKFAAAYRHLYNALSAQPDNPRALADLPLVALKAGRIDAAIKAAEDGIKSSSPASQASAWFNMGLICEQEDNRRRFFRGAIECDPDWVFPFVQAWKLQPTRGRAAKLREVFERKGAIACLTPKGEVGQRIWRLTSGFVATEVERIHILHQIDDQVDIEDTSDVTRLVDAPMQELAITSLERKENGELPTINGQACRTPPQPSGKAQ